MNSELLIQLEPDIASLLEGADHIDVKTLEGEVKMREFIAGLFTYQPAWVTFLYYVRSGFVRLLGMRQEGIPNAIYLRPEDVPMDIGQPATFFTVALAKEEHYWFAGITESHLTAHLGVVIEPLTHSMRRFHVITVVHYHHWTGRLYFNVIRPFHHLIVYRMAKSGLRGVPSALD